MFLRNVLKENEPKTRSVLSRLIGTLFEIFIFCPKIQLWFPEKNCRIVLVKTREIAAVLEFLAVDNFDFTRKNVKNIWMKNSWKCFGFGLFSCWQLWFQEKNGQKKLGEKLVKMLGFCQNWIFGQKFDFSNSVTS